MAARRLFAVLTACSAFALVSCGGGDDGGAPPAATVLLSGVARFESVPTSASTGALVYSATLAKPIRGARVEVLAFPTNAVLGVGDTDANGGYAVLIPPTESVRVRIKAQMTRGGAPGWDFRVLDNTSGNAQYALDSPVVSGVTSGPVPDLVAGSGWTGSSYGAPRSAGPFAVLDTVYDALQKTLTVAPMQVWPPLSLFWSINNRPSPGNPATGFIETTFFVPSFDAGAIYILGQADVDTDEYDGHVIAHEFGHYVQWAASRDDSPGGDHFFGDRLDMRVALAEGWSSAWSGIVFDDPVYRNSFGNGQSTGFTFDVSTAPTSQPGWYNEDSLAYVIWRVNAQLGFATLWQAFTGPMRTTGLATSAHLLAAALKQVAPAQAASVNTIFASQSIATADAQGSTETNNGGIADALPVYKQYPGIGSTLPVCVTDAAGKWNKLGNFVFVHVTIPSTRTYAIQVGAGGAATDPDFQIFNAVFSRFATSGVAGFEQLVVNLVAGTYVIAVEDFNLNGRQCFNLSIN